MTASARINAHRQGDNLTQTLLTFGALGSIVDSSFTTDRSALMRSAFVMRWLVLSRASAFRANACNAQEKTRASVNADPVLLRLAPIHRAYITTTMDILGMLCTTTNGLPL